jgi:hypothetical protein
MRMLRLEATRQNVTTVSEIKDSRAVELGPMKSSLTVGGRLPKTLVNLELASSLFVAPTFHDPACPQTDVFDPALPSH